MHITLERFVSDDDSSLSNLFIDGVHNCFTVEDEFREVKVAGETRIPAGRYKIGVRTVGGFHARYGRRYRGWHQGMLEILDVPGFTNILFHRGNSEKDTAGCPCVNTGVIARRGDMSGQSSDEAYRRFYPRVIEAALAGDLTIEIIDRDRAA